MNCRNCGAEVHQNAIACPKCGMAPLTEKKFCQECGAETKENQIMCIKCGCKLINKKSGSTTIGNLNIDTQSITESLGQINLKPVNIPALIISILMFIALFLPWYSASGIGGGFNYGNNWIQGFDGGFSINALKSDYGVFALIFTIAAVILTFVRFKWSFIAGILSLLFSIIFIVDLPEASFSGYGYSAHAGPAWGIFVFMALSFIYSVLNIKALKTN
jgi:hypothetical protein